MKMHLEFRPKLTAFLLALAMMLGVSAALGQDMADASTVRVTLTNASQQVISPPLLIAHDSSYSPFVVGDPASPELARLAEDGDASELAAIARLDTAVVAVVIADSPLPPGQSVTLEIETSMDAPYLSVLGMLVTTNDAFVAWSGDARELGEMGEMGEMGMGAAPALLDAVARVFDAGSEANTELCEHIPGPPCGSAGVRVVDGAEGHVSLHGGILGIGDLDPAEWDWRNPVLEVDAGS